MSEPSAEAHAMRIAKRAAEAWRQAQGGDDSTAVGVVAALALTDRAAPSGPDRAQMLAGSSDEAIAGALSGIWAQFWIARPELGRLVGPLARWVNDTNPAQGKVRAIADVARAATQSGLLDLVDTGALRHTDVIGLMYHQMRTQSGAAADWARGEFVTPAAVCKLMAATALSGPELLKPGSALEAGPSGTGELLLAYAEHIREQGKDPAGFWWIAHGISPAAVAVTAVNCHLWDLGPHVVIGIADSIAEPGWPERAWAEQQAAVAHRDELVQAGAMLAAAGSSPASPPTLPASAAASQRPSPDFPAGPAQSVQGRTAGPRRPAVPPGGPASRRTP